MATKQYKLLKDLPFAKAGDILTYNYDETKSLYLIGRTYIEQVLDKHIDDPDWFELVVEKPKPVMKFDNGAVVEYLCSDSIKTNKHN